LTTNEAAPEVAREEKEAVVADVEPAAEVADDEEQQAEARDAEHQDTTLTRKSTEGLESAREKDAEDSRDVEDEQDEDARPVEEDAQPQEEPKTKVAPPSKLGKKRKQAIVATAEKHEDEEEEPVRECVEIPACACNQDCCPGCRCVLGACYDLKIIRAIKGKKKKHWTF